MAGMNPGNVHPVEVNVGKLHTVEPGVNVVVVSDALAVVCDGVTNKPGAAVAADVDAFTIEGARSLLVEIHQRKHEAQQFLDTLDVADMVVRSQASGVASLSPFDDEDAGSRVDSLRTMAQEKRAGSAEAARSR